MKLLYLLYINAFVALDFGNDIKLSTFQRYNGVYKQSVYFVYQQIQQTDFKYPFILDIHSPNILIPSNAIDPKGLSCQQEYCKVLGETESLNYQGMDFQVRKIESNFKLFSNQPVEQQQQLFLIDSTTSGPFQQDPFAVLGLFKGGQFHQYVQKNYSNGLSLQINVEKNDFSVIANPSNMTTQYSSEFEGNVVASLSTGQQDFEKQSISVDINTFDYIIGLKEQEKKEFEEKVFFKLCGKKKCEERLSLDHMEEWVFDFEGSKIIFKPEDYLEFKETTPFYKQQYFLKVYVIPSNMKQNMALGRSFFEKVMLILTFQQNSVKIQLGLKEQKSDHTFLKNFLILFFSLLLSTFGYYLYERMKKNRTESRSQNLI